MANENLSIGFFCLENFFDLSGSEAVLLEFTKELEGLAAM